MNKVAILPTTKTSSDHSDVLLTRLIRELATEILSFNFYKKDLSIIDFTEEENEAFKEVVISDVCWEQYYIPETRTIELVYDKFLVWVNLDKEIKHSVTVKSLDADLRFDEYCILESDLLNSLVPISIFTALSTFYPVGEELVTLTELKESIRELMFSNKPDTYPNGLLENILNWVDRLVDFSLESFINLIYSNVSFEDGSIALPSFLLPHIHPTMDANLVRMVTEADDGVDYRKSCNRGDCSVYPLLLIKHDGKEARLDDLKLNIFGNIQSKQNGEAVYINYALILDLLN